MKSLSGSICIGLCLAACVHLPPSLPEMNAVAVTGEPLQQLARQWHGGGFEHADFYQLNSRFQPPSPATAYMSSITLLAPRNRGWKMDRLLAFSRHLPQRLADCGITSKQILLVFIDAPTGGMNTLHEWVSKVPGQEQPLFIFTDNTGKDPYGRNSGGMMLHDNKQRPFALIAAHSSDNRTFAPEQTLAHELGHILALEHAPSLTEGGYRNVNLMQPRGCLYCSFTPTQCTSLRSHAWVHSDEPGIVGE